jgi:hypothetical protein
VVHRWTALETVTRTRCDSGSGRRKVLCSNQSKDEPRETLYFGDCFCYQECCRTRQSIGMVKIEPECLQVHLLVCMS